MYLSQHHLLSSQNLDELRDILGRQFSQHELNIMRKGHEVDAFVNGCAINDLGLTYVSYGSDVSIEARIHEEQCSDVISLNILTSGTGCLQKNGREWGLSLKKGAVFSMQQPLVFSSSGCSGIVLSLPIVSVMRHARALLGDQIDQIDFKFDTTIDLTTPLGKILYNTIIRTTLDMNGSLGGLDNSIAITNLENYLLSQFIVLQPNSFMSLSQQTIDREIMPCHIKRAREYIHAYAHEKITLYDLATYAGCSYRTLQTLFNKVFGISPMTYLSAIRLERVHEALLDADYQVFTVSNIAKKWGFTHMGRLAESYKKQYGITPSESLRQEK